MDTVDGRNDQAVQSICYDGFGNRISVSIGADSVSYGYDLNHRLVSSSLNEEWRYDAVGNNTFQRQANGATATTAYDGENRATRSDSHSLNDGEWSDTTTWMRYDGAGNATVTTTRADGYGFDEYAHYDVRYNVQRKHIANAYIEGARYLYGDA
ncbi:MAG: hypothetical protein KZQ97_21745 [Candidatus Thiodiazotropha sp. (ex Dulcina madagascariensis)]|nr:hypothetical protein [Candidatus Thiodiazotropha sp. (ex Dulcina madagascariensis)]